MPPRLFYFRQKVKRMSIEQKDPNLPDLFRQLFDRLQIENNKVEQRAEKLIRGYQLAANLDQKAKGSEPPWIAPTKIKSVSI